MKTMKTTHTKGVHISYLGYVFCFRGYTFFWVLEFLDINESLIEQHVSDWVADLYTIATEKYVPSKTEYVPRYQSSPLLMVSMESIYVYLCKYKLLNF